jgi:hypothetical protein
MPTTNAAKVKLLTLTERLSRKGTRYMTGILGHATVIAFPRDENDYGQEWTVYLQERSSAAATASGKSADASKGWVDEGALRDLFKPL